MVKIRDVFSCSWMSTVPRVTTFLLFPPHKQRCLSVFVYDSYLVNSFLKMTTDVVSGAEPVHQALSDRGVLIPRIPVVER